MSQRGYLAVDIGGTKLSVGVVSTTGEVLSHGRTDAPSECLAGAARADNRSSH